jgi:hypothetical protein
MSAARSFSKKRELKKKNDDIMRYEEKARIFREIAYKENGLTYPPKERRVGDPAPERMKWKNKKELEEYLNGVGGRFKMDNKRRRGYLVVDLNEGMNPPQIIEVPMDFAMKALALGGLP